MLMYYIKVSYCRIGYLDWAQEQIIYNLENDEQQIKKLQNSATIIDKKFEFVFAMLIPKKCDVKKLIDKLFC